MTTIKDVARKAGVSISTVSKYINGGRVRPENLQSIQAAIEELDFRVNPFGRSLKTQKSYCVGILLPNISAPFIAAVLSSINQVLLQSGYHTLVACYYRSHGLERDTLNFMIESRMDGLIYLPEHLTSDEFLEITTGNRVPFVLVDKLLANVDADTVVTDNFDASFQAVSHIIRAGHRRIGAIAGPGTASTTRERIAGYLRALSKNSIPYDDTLVRGGDLSFSTGYQGLQELLGLENPPTAVFCANHDITIGAVTAAREQGLRIPDDLELFGYDCGELCGMMRPPVPVVQQPEEEIGRTAARYLLERISGCSEPPRLTRLACTLTI